MERKTIKIKFVDFWQGFDIENDLRWNILNKYYEVKIVEENPDYIFFSVYSDENLKYDCIKIFYTGENLVPDFNLCDYAIGFHNISFDDRYIRCPNYYNMYYDDAYEKMKKKNELVDENLYKYRGFCSFVYSNSEAVSIREELFYLLSKYKQVDSGGGFLNNIGNRVSDKVAFEAGYRFSIVCENSATDGYITEKIIQAYAARTIPIYFGANDIDQYFNPKSFINVRDFSDKLALLDHIKLIDKTPELYLSMLSEPALINNNMKEEDIKRLETFLLRIFDQNRDEAYRRNMICRGKIYQKEQLEKSLAYNRGGR